ncbi:hypothetical protein FJ651_02270 [Paucihalobacter ruber]|uniref:Ig-like domain-containing protein n=1 Tax=Paucihalobacter ruber TaxID=2567861 RepID=A0A506PR80_9FLAO|nr:DUF6266 family protein [Paucihalobacter ruber]TPV35762.1 hypothetical protein FJ651_02270 [Paucihalobacter ruber]
MARIVKNPFGELSGKVGELVFKKGKNGAYISMVPTPTKKKPSVLQERQRLKMTTVMDFLKPLKRLLQEAYVPFASQKSGFHAAKSYYLREVVIPVNDSFTIDYPKALISFGDLRPATGVQLTCLTTGRQPGSAPQEIRLSWTNNSDQAMAYGDDALIIVTHTPERSITNIRYDLAVRAEGEVTLQLGMYATGAVTHVWLGFYRPHEQRAAMSTYAGSVVV